MAVRGITIRNKFPSAEVDLPKILIAIGDKGIISRWKLTNSEFNGECADLLHEVADTQSEIDGKRFIELASGFCQFLEGEAIASLPDSPNWLVIRSIRGDEFDIETKDFEIIERLKASFHYVLDLNY